MKINLKTIGPAALAVAVAVALVPTPARAAAKLVAGWDFEKVEADGVSIKSLVGPAVGTITGAAVLTAAGEGRPKGGGKGFDVSAANPGWLQVGVDADNNAGATATILEAGKNDQVTVVLWQKNNNNINSSSVWIRSDINDRWFQFHIPWSDGTIYFDTAGGCCAAPGQRLNKGVVATYPDYDWLAWHHYAFVKDVGAKRVYIDGELFMSQDEGADPLNLEGAFYRFTIGGADQSAPPDAILDDVAIFQGALTEAEIVALAKGGSPFAPPVDTDKDGMTDDFEIAAGLNPADASDAAKDCDGDGVSNLDEFKAATDPCDKTAPTLVKAASTAINSVTLTFSEALNETVAADKSHYSISPSIAVTAAVVSKGKVVTLTTADQAPGAIHYTVTVNGVSDISKNVIASGANASWYSVVTTKDKVGGVVGVFTGNSAFSIDGAGKSGKAGDRAFAAPTGGQVNVLNVDFVRAAVAADEMSISLWQKKADTVASASFNLESPGNLKRDYDGTGTPVAVANSTRNFFAHLPWDNFNIYFDGPGCCDTFQRINADATGFGTIVDATSWRDWHHFVFTKKGGAKQIFIDGALFLDGADQHPLFTELVELTIGGAAATGTGPSHGWIDDFAVYSKALVDADAAALAGGKLPSELAAAKGLIAYWDFNDAPPGGSVGGAYPAAGTLFGVPNKVQIKHFDGTAPWDKTKASLQIDGATVASTADQVAGTITITHTPSFAAKSTHTATLLYDGGFVFSWDFTVGVSTKDTVKGYLGVLTQNAVISADALGHTGKAGDRALDQTKKGGPVYVPNQDKFIDAATSKDELSISLWQKKYDTVDSSGFVVNSASTPNQRVFHAHLPWSSQHIYFDTMGCCDAATQRIEAGIDTFPDYPIVDPVVNTWWTTLWHHFVFTKKADQKNIYIDGKLFLNGSSTLSMAGATDIDGVWIGAGGGGTVEINHALVDDFAMFSKELTPAQVQSLFTSTPTALPASAGLMAFFPFDDAPVVPPVGITGLKAVAAADKVTITFTGDGVVQAADKLDGAFTDTAIKSGDVITAAGTKFYRGKK